MHVNVTALDCRWTYRPTCTCTIALSCPRRNRALKWMSLLCSLLFSNGKNFETSLKCWPILIKAEPDFVVPSGRRSIVSSKRAATWIPKQTTFKLLSCQGRPRGGARVTGVAAGCAPPRKRHFCADLGARTRAALWEDTRENCRLSNKSSGHRGPPSAVRMRLRVFRSVLQTVSGQMFRPRGNMHSAEGYPMLGCSC